MKKTQLLIRITGEALENGLLTVCGNGRIGRILFLERIYVFGAMLCDAPPRISREKSGETECILTLREGEYFIAFSGKNCLFIVSSKVKENSCNIIEFHIPAPTGEG